MTQLGHHRWKDDGGVHHGNGHGNGSTNAERGQGGVGEKQHPHETNGHGDARVEHRLTSRSATHGCGGSDVPTSLKFLSKPVHEEERIIYGYTDADERDDVRGVDGDVGHVGEPNGHPDGSHHGAHPNTHGEQSCHYGAEHHAEDDE